jgi:hypothetical protein
MNQGERDELIAIMTMLFLKGQGKGFTGVACVHSVGNRVRVYRDWDPRLGSPQQLRDLSDEQLAAVARSLGISKAGSGQKADVFINEVGYSLKSHRSAPPAIVNHTTRPGWEFACSHSRTSVTWLDGAVASYWVLREQGTIREDVANDDPNSPFAPLMEELSPVLSYFLFRGTGTRLSGAPAAKVLDVAEPTDPKTWSVLSPESVVSQVWERLVFSIRSKKGMPVGYPNMRPAEAAKKRSIERWTRYWQSEYRGALHVRVRQS